MSWVRNAAIAERKISKFSSGNGYVSFISFLLQPTLISQITFVTVKLDSQPSCLEVGSTFLIFRSSY